MTKKYLCGKKELYGQESFVIMELSINGREGFGMGCHVFGLVGIVLGPGRPSLLEAASGSADRIFVCLHGYAAGTQCYCKRLWGAKRWIMLGDGFYVKRIEKDIRLS